MPLIVCEAFLKKSAYVIDFFFCTTHAVNIAKIVDPRSLYRHGNGYYKIKKILYTVNYTIWGSDYANIVDIHSMILIS